MDELKKQGFDRCASQTLALSRFVLPRGSFAFILLYLAADIFHCALATLADVFNHSLAAVADIGINFLAPLTELSGKFICAGACFSCSGFGAGDCLFRCGLCAVAQLNGSIPDYLASFLS